MLKLEGKVAIVTGSTSGIGVGIAKLFAQEGAKVVICGRREAKGQAVVDAIVKEGGEAYYHFMDITVVESIDALFKDTVEKYGKIDWQTLLNNNDNLEFVMLRATYGLSGIDGQFFENTSNLSKTNLKIGAYHECFAQSIQEAINEAKYFLKVVKSQKISYPLAVKISNEFDIEMGKDFTSDILNFTFIHIPHINQRTDKFTSIF